MKKEVMLQCGKCGAIKDGLYDTKTREPKPKRCDSCKKGRMRVLELA